MNKKGFTLIELLAVIVILAIIALIATPIVLNIIEDSKKSATLRSAEFYMDAVDYAVANRLMNNKSVESGEYNILENGNVCLKYDDADNTQCADELIVEVNGEKPNSGTIKIEGSKINTSTLVFDNGTVNKDANGEYIYVESGNSGADNNTQNNSICTLVNDADNDGQITAGDKYHCDVDPNQEEEFYFYVLKTPVKGNVISLIMDQNINSDGTPAGSTKVTQTTNPQQYNVVEWVSQTDYNDDANYGENGNTNKGPITAMKFLYEATKNWTNVPALGYLYSDRSHQGGDYGYELFESINGVATITSDTDPIVTTTIGTNETPLRARMMINSRIYNSDDDTFTYLGDYTDTGDTSHYYYNLSEEGAPGYWTMSTSPTGSSYVWGINVFHGMMIPYENVHSNGVRPVITLEI